MKANHFNAAQLIRCENERAQVLRTNRFAMWNAVTYLDNGISNSETLPRVRKRRFEAARIA
jgi:hypothetical protein